MIFDLSEQLKEMRGFLKDREHEGVMLPPEHVSLAIRKLNTCLALAQELEADFSQREWNRRAAGDREGRAAHAARLQAVIGRPGNVVAFRPGQWKEPGRTSGGGDAA